MAANFLEQPGASIPDACGDWAGTKACYRLFDHEEVTDKRILEAHREANIYELLAACHQERAMSGDGAGFLIRSRHDRQLDREGGGRLWQTPADLTILAGLEVEIPLENRD